MTIPIIIPNKVTESQTKSVFFKKTFSMIWCVHFFNHIPKGTYYMCKIKCAAAHSAPFQFLYIFFFLNSGLQVYLLQVSQTKKTQNKSCCCLQTDSILTPFANNFLNNGFSFHRCCPVHCKCLKGNIQALLKMDFKGTCDLT